MAAPRIKPRRLAELTPSATNARTHSDAQVAQIAESLVLFGFTNPVLVDQDGIVAGHGRVMAVKRVEDAGGALRFPGGDPIPPSLLPRHRGRDAVKWTVHMGDPIAGGSVYWLTNRIDGGPIAAADWFHVKPGSTASDLWHDHLFPMGVRLLVETLADLDAGRMVKVAQTEACATWEPSWDRPPVDRPDLPQLTAGVDRVADRFHIVTDRNAA